MKIMFGHDDFSAVQKLWTAFWQGENKSPLFAVTIPKNGKTADPMPPYLSWFSGAYDDAAAQAARWRESREFYGAAVPCFQCSFGSDDFAAFTGADLSYNPIGGDSTGGTSWCGHVLKSLEKAEIRFEPQGKWWTKTREFYRALKRRLGGEVMIAAPNIGAGLDALSALYGPEELLLALMDDPCLVRRSLDQIDAAYTETIKACAELFEFEKYGSVTRHGMYSPGWINIPQCDFSCMISPAFFEEFAVPSLTHEFSFMTGGEYHFDGPGAIKHLESIVNIPGLEVIQWVPGAGTGEQQDWTSLYKRILSLGKGLILGCNAEGAEELVRKFRSRKLFVQIWGLKTRTEAEDFLYRMDKVWESIEANSQEAIV
jgi:5-methyltetrahydrofolate--homocysteine methyltransferase